MKRWAIILLFVSMKASAVALTFPELIQASITNPLCVQYRIAGMCIWLKCGPFGCAILTSTLVEHNNPDVVVEVSQTEIRPLAPLTTALLKAGGVVTAGVSGFPLGNGNQQGKTKSSNNIQMHDSVALGNPALPIYDATVGSIYGAFGWCRSSVIPLTPYFISTASPEWRYNWLEGPMWLPNMFRTLGKGTLSTWGSIYPRIGFVHQADTYKSSAVIAQRTADIISLPGSLHVAIPLPITSPGNFTFKPLKIMESNPLNSSWQLNYPRGRQNMPCMSFPSPIELTEFKSMTKNYVWTLWRRYKCCSRRGKLISVVGF